MEPEVRVSNLLARLNLDLPAEALEEVFRKLTRLEGADFARGNRLVHRLFVDGVTVEYRSAGGEIRSAQAFQLDVAHGCE